MAADRYEMHGKIGEGAVSEVYRARDHALGRWVALKILKPACGLGHESAVRFRAEAQAAAQIIHPNVVVIFDVIESPEQPAIVMELVEGTSLAGRLRLLQKIEESTAIRYAVHIAQALSAAHERNVIHRDIKPSNILLGPDDGVKVADFGIAKALDVQNGTLTREGTFLGSVHYISPEQAQGLPVTPASDLYSLGIVLYELAFGRVPFEEDSALSTALAHIEKSAPSRRHLEQAMSPALARIVERLLQKDPSERFQTAGELVTALQAIPAPAEQPTLIAAPIPRRAAAATAAEGTASASGAWRAAAEAAAEALMQRSRSHVHAWLQKARTVRLPHPPPLQWDRRLTAGSAAAVLFITVTALLTRYGHPAASHPAATARPVTHLAGQAATRILRMPNLDNVPVSRAGAILYHMRLHAHIRAVYSDAPLFTVVGQYPGPAATVAPGADVVMVVSGGLPPGFARKVHQP